MFIATKIKLHAMRCKLKKFALGHKYYKFVQYSLSYNGFTWEKDN